MLLVIGIGHSQGQYLVQTQPMKMAAAEAHWETSDPAAFTIIAGIDEAQQNNRWEIAVPKLLSFMSYNHFSGEVRGIKDLQAEMEAQYGPGNYVPPVAVNFWSFRTMLAAGFIMLLMALLAVIYQRREERLLQRTVYLKLMFLALFLPYIANTAGWMLAEMGRQPWIVYGLQRVEQGVSSVVSAGSILLTLISFALIYMALIVVDVYLLAKYARQTPGTMMPEPADSNDKEGSWWI